MTGAPPTTPYVGLRPYEALHRGLFHGRAAEAAAVLEQWLAAPLTVLYGPPGVGKTSLLQAAVIPAASERARPGDVVLPVSRIASTAGMVPATDRNPLVGAVLSSWSTPSASIDPVPIDPAPIDPAPLVLPAFANRLRSVSDEPAAILAAIDQFELVFHAGMAAYQKDFLTQLVAAVQQVPGFRLLISVREDSVAELAAIEAVIPGAGRYRLDPLGVAAAVEAVTGPVRGSGRSYAPGAAEEVVRNLRASRLVNALEGSREVLADTVEPAQLQAACSALWQALPGDLEVITREHLYSPGDLDGALVRWCERAVHEVAAALALPERELWTWLVRTFSTDLGARGTAYEGAADVSGMPNEAARQLVDRYLLTTESRLGSRWYKLPNDRLIAPVQEAASRWAAKALIGVSRPAASLAEAEAALAAGNLALATRRAVEAVRTSGSDLHTRATALSCLGRLAAEAGHDQEAEAHYRAAASLFVLLQDQTGAGRSLAGLGRILLRRGRYAEAVAELQGAEARVPSDLAIQIDLARALRDSGQLLAATAVLGATLTIAPGTVDALVERGLIRIRTGEFSYALDDLDDAIRLQPSIGQLDEIRSARAYARAHLNQTA